MPTKKQKGEKGEEPIAKVRSSSRHRPRSMVPVPRDLYDRFAKLADSRSQSVASEIRRLILAELKASGH